jgi:hypothetical protein
VSRAAIVALAACSHPAAPPSGSFEIVGHSDLGARGMNAALAVAGDTVYVGSRIDGKPIAIVDVSDPRQPSMVGELGAPDEGLVGMSSRELRTVPETDLLIVLNLKCSPSLHGCSTAQPEPENLKLFDISDRRAPRLVATYPIASSLRVPRSPHEMFVRRASGRTLVLLTTPGAAPQLEILDITAPASPVQLAAWDARADGGLGGPSTPDNILHSVSTSDDGRTAYLSHQQAGLALADISDLAHPQLITPPGGGLVWGPPSKSIGPHSAVQVPAHPLLVVTEEIYPTPFGTGCPWGHLRIVDVTDPAHPAVAGEFALPENDPSTCGAYPPATTYTSHNATVTQHLALVTWYAGGLQA